MKDIKEEFIHIQTSRFLVEPDEDDEIVNEGMYGAAISTYLETELNKRNYEGGAVSEDFGYWLGFSHPDAPLAKLEVTVHCPNGRNQNPMEYVILVMTHRTKRWVWAKFKSISFEPAILKLQADVRDILKNAPETKILSISDDMPE